MVATEMTSKGTVYNPVIVDFGLSKIFLFGERAIERVGTLVYSSPEILLKGYSHSFAADVWSAGVILYLMLVGFFPFFIPNARHEEIIYLIMRGNLNLTAPQFMTVSPPAKDLLIRML
jgi:calcium-dependent protein kinase